MRTLIAFSLLACVASFAEATPALSIISGEPGGRTLLDSTHGWQFRANASIVVTHLGLFDYNDDGLGNDYPIGIFDLDTAILLTSGVVHAGIADSLIERFRYVDTPDIRLTIGEEYVIAWYTPTTPPLVLDRHFTTDGEFPTSPAITRTAHSLFKGTTGGLTLPVFSDGDDHRVGPNFLFVPEPSTLVLVMMASLGLLFPRCTRNG